MQWSINANLVRFCHSARRDAGVSPGPAPKGAPGASPNGSSFQVTAGAQQPDDQHIPKIKGAPSITGLSKTIKGRLQLLEGLAARQLAIPTESPLNKQGSYSKLSKTESKAKLPKIKILSPKRKPFAPGYSRRRSHQVAPHSTLVSAARSDDELGQTFMTGADIDDIPRGFPRDASHTSLNQMRVQEGLRNLKPDFTRKNSEEQMANLRQMMLSFSPAANEMQLNKMGLGVTSNLRYIKKTRNKATFKSGGSISQQDDNKFLEKLLKKNEGIGLKQDDLAAKIRDSIEEKDYSMHYLSPRSKAINESSNLPQTKLNRVA